MDNMDYENEPTVVKTMEETDEKCPQCGGIMEFHPATGGLKCPYCDFEKEIKQSSEKPERAQELDFASASNAENCNWGQEKKTVLCQSCGAETVYDALDISSTCPFCGSNQVMEAGDQNTIAPGGVVLFKISDQQASELFQKWIKKKFFCPKLAKESAKAKNFKGIYLPYWTFDSNTVTSYNGEYGRRRTVRRGDKTETVTDWYHTRGVHREFIDDELVCATTNQNRSMLRGIEPYNTADNKTYKPEYVAGFAAERYAVGLQDAWQTAKKSIASKLKRNVEQEIRTKNHADTTRNINMNTVYHDIKYKYLLLPVWMSSYKYNDKVYNFMVNGQTGKVSGKTPISVPKVIITVVAAIAIIVLLYLILGN